MRTTLPVLVASLLLSSCVGVTSTNAPTAQDNIGAEEYEVYAAVIDAMYMTNRIDRIVIKDHTTTSRSASGALSFSSDVAQETLDDFLRKNEQPHLLSDNWNLGVDCVLISQEEIAEVFGDVGNWNRFYVRYPNSQGVMTLSRVGFNQERTQALVYVGNQSDSLAGAGYYVLLVKRLWWWAVQEKVVLWIS